jgi:UPF0716 protein FxsA
MVRLLGCFGVLLFLAIGVVEVWSYLVASRLLTTYARDTFATGLETILPIALVQIVLMVAGVMIAKRLAARLPTALMGSLMGGSKDLGRMAVAFVGAICLVLPGFFLDILGILLLLPPVQILFASLGQRVLMGLVRRQMSQMGMGAMFGGGKPGAGFPGGFPGGPFPGMQPRGGLTPDDRIGPARPGKVVDVEAERVERN